MSQIALPLFLLLLVIGAIVIGVTTDQLPAQIASHFSAGGAATAGSAAAVTYFHAGVRSRHPSGHRLQHELLPRVSDKAINLPNRDHWLGPTQREATFRFLTAHACWLGSLMVVFIVGIHLLLIAANADAAAPPADATVHHAAGAVPDGARNLGGDAGPAISRHCLIRRDPVHAVTLTMAERRPSCCASTRPCGRKSAPGAGRAAQRECPGRVPAARCACATRRQPKARQAFRRE